MKADWRLHNDPHYPAWVYRDGQAWVRHFEAAPARPEHWQAYRMTEKPKSGRAPWGHQNARIGVDGVGYPTLQAAIEAAEQTVNPSKQESLL